jgi:Flp pilus assembly protein TadG
MLLVLVLGTLEVTYALYARNVVVASAHEGARAAIERGGTLNDARQVAATSVVRTAGGLVRDLEVTTASTSSSEGATVRVTVSGTLRAFGPVPIPIHLSSSSTAVRRTLHP